MTTAQQELAERLAEVASGDEPSSDVNYILKRSERDTIVTALRAHDDMLAALKLMMALYESYPVEPPPGSIKIELPWVSTVRDAIAKAEGRT